METTFFDNAKVMSKGQVTIPKDVRTVLGITEGDKLMFVVENGVVTIQNAAIFAMQMLQKQMKTEKSMPEEEINSLVKEVRHEVTNNENIN